MIKQVIVMRKDLNMRKGKMAAQAAHASMKVLLQDSIVMGPELHDKKGFLLAPVNRDTADWLEGIFTKICLSCIGEDELDSLYAEATAEGIPCALVIDSGATEFHNTPTKTCIGIGPAESERIDKITGHLPLL